MIFSPMSLGLFSLLPHGLFHDNYLNIKVPNRSDSNTEGVILTPTCCKTPRSLNKWMRNNEHFAEVLLIKLLIANTFCVTCIVSVLPHCSPERQSRIWKVSLPKTVQLVRVELGCESTSTQSRTCAQPAHSRTVWKTLESGSILRNLIRHEAASGCGWFFPAWGWRHSCTGIWSPLLVPSCWHRMLS